MHQKTKVYHIDRFVRFLSSKRSVMLRQMKQEMDEASKDMRFEEAAALRDQITEIKQQTFVS